MGDDTDGRAVLLHLGQIGLDGLLSIIVSPLLGILSESLLLRLAPAMNCEHSAFMISH